MNRQPRAVRTELLRLSLRTREPFHADRPTNPQLCLKLCLTEYSGSTGGLGPDYFLRTSCKSATYPLEMGAKRPDSDPRLQS